MKKRKPEEVDYNEVLKSIELQRIYLRRGNCQLDARLIDIGKIRPELTEDYAWESLPDQRFVIDYTFAFSGDSMNKSLISAECTFSAEFACSRAISQDFIDTFSVLAVRFLVFPFAREFFSSMTSKMDLPSLLLPLFIISPQQGPARKKSASAKQR